MVYFTFTMCRWFNLLLLLCFIKYSEISGNTRRSVTGEEGGNVILSCDFEARDILAIDLIRFSKIIPVCQNVECESDNSRFLKTGSCDVIIKDLTFSDAGKYMLRVHYIDDQTELKHHIQEHHLHLHTAITVEIGKTLKLDVLFNADRVEKNSSGEWTEVWTRGHEVRSDQLTVRDQTLTIKAFTSTDSGTYRVLDSEGEILITVTVTASNTGSKGKLDTDEDETNEPWIIVLSVIGALVVLVLVLVISAVIIIKIHQCLYNNTKQKTKPFQAVAMQEIVQ